MSTKTEFREEAVSEQFDSNKKPFLSILPPSSTAVFLFFALLLSALAIGLFTVKLPVQMHGDGLITSGIESIPVKITHSNQLIENISVNSGDVVNKGQALFSLSKKHLPETTNTIREINTSIANIEQEIIMLERSLQKHSAVISASLEQQHALIDSIETQLSKARLFEQEALENHKKGLSAVFDYQRRQSESSAIASQLERAKMEKESIKREALSSSNQTERLIFAAKEKKMLLVERLKSFDTTWVYSPCDCRVEHLLIKTDQLTSADSVAVVLSKAAKNNTAKVFIRSDEYKPIEINSTVLIEPKSYPSLKHGSITGKVETVYQQPISSKEYPNVLHSSGHYFVLDVDIKNAPQDVSLQHGMQFQADVITSYQTLAQFIFE